MLPGVNDALEPSPVAEVDGSARDALEPARVVAHHRVTGGAARLLEVVDHARELTSMSEAGGILGAVSAPIPVDELLAFESAHPRHSGWKEEAIRARFGIPPARYYQLLGRAIDTREALELDPMLVHRLRRIRDTRLAARERRLRAG